MSKPVTEKQIGSAMEGSQDVCHATHAGARATLAQCARSGCAEGLGCRRAREKGGAEAHCFGLPKVHRRLRPWARGRRDAAVLEARARRAAIEAWPRPSQSAAVLRRWEAIRAPCIRPSPGRASMTAASVLVVEPAAGRSGVAFGSLIDIASLQAGTTPAEICEACNTINMGAAMLASAALTTAGVLCGQEFRRSDATGQADTHRAWAAWALDFAAFWLVISFLVVITKFIPIP